MAKINKHIENYVNTKIAALTKHKEAAIRKEYDERVKLALEEIDEIKKRALNDINHVVDKYNLDSISESNIFMPYYVRNSEEFNDFRKQEYKIRENAGLIFSKVIALASLEKSLTLERIDELIDELVAEN